MDRPAPVEHPVHDLIRLRWSPRAFADRSVEEEALRSLFEAARWAASCYNEQPWRFIVARREDAEAFERVASCLVTNNRAWAVKAPVIGLSVTSTRFAKNDKPNRHAFHDVGLAMGNLTIEAMARGLYVHQMAGIKPEKALEVFDVPEGFEVVAGLAIGYPGDPQTLPEQLRERELAERTRRPLTDTVFGADFGQAAAWLAQG